MGEERYNNRPQAQRWPRHQSGTYQIIPEMPKPAEVSGGSRVYYASGKDGKVISAVALIASLIEMDRLFAQLAFSRSMR